MRDSNDGKLIAHKFTRNCGATTGNNVQISLLDAGEENREKGNVFIADGGGTERIAEPIASVDAEWLNGKLIIQYDKKLRIFKKENNQKGIQIEYK